MKTGLQLHPSWHIPLIALQLFCFTPAPTHLFFFNSVFSSTVAMEKQIEELKQQLEKQCLINKELQRQNKDLGECACVELKVALTALCGHETF